MNEIQWIQEGDRILSVIIRRSFAAYKTAFITPDDFIQQAGFVVYPAGGEIANHAHHPIHRSIVGTPETLIVRKGKLVARFYNETHELKGEETLEAGDILMLVNGGHGFTMLEDTVLFEIKQGPYTGLVEKEHFR